MALINTEAKELHYKVVYFGPAQSGKATNINWIYENSGAKDKAKLSRFSTQSNFTFDFLPLNVGEIRGMKTKLHLYTIPDIDARDPSGRLIMKNLDGVVFVADSQKERMEENQNSLLNLQAHLEQQGYEIHKLPLVFQYNKRDLANAAEIADLRANLNKFNSPDFEAQAASGKGVFEVLKSISKSVISSLKGAEL